MSRRGLHYTKTLQNIISRKGSSKTLTFSAPHVFMALQMLSEQEFVSRREFCKRIRIGEGAARTMCSRLKEHGMAESMRSGTYLTADGRNLASRIAESISDECKISKSQTLRSEYNYAIVLRGHAEAINLGVEQRDHAIRYGAVGAITVVYKDGRFVFPTSDNPAFADDPDTAKILTARLNLRPYDIVIIASAKDPVTAEMSAKHAALQTVSEAQN